MKETTEEERTGEIITREIEDIVQETREHPAQEAIPERDIDSKFIRNTKN